MIGLILRAVATSAFTRLRRPFLRKVSRFSSTKKSVLFFNIFIHNADNILKRKAGIFALYNFHCNQSLPYRSRTGIENMNLNAFLLLMKKTCSKHCTVIGTTEFRGKSNAIYMFSFAVKCLSVALWRRAG